MYSLIKRYVTNCFSCVGHQGYIEKPLAPLQREHIGQRPLERVAMDVIGPLRISLEGNQYLIVGINYFTRYPEAYPVPVMQSATVSKVLECFICTHVILENKLMDLGTNFISQTMMEAGLSGFFHCGKNHFVHFKSFDVVNRKHRI